MLGYRDNDPENLIIEYMFHVHLMGLTSSPAVAILAVRYAAREEPPSSGAQWLQKDDSLDPKQSETTGIQYLVEQSLANPIYIDKSVASANTETEALNLLTLGISRFPHYRTKVSKSVRFKHTQRKIERHFQGIAESKKLVILASIHLFSLTTEKSHTELGLQRDLDNDIITAHHMLFHTCGHHLRNYYLGSSFDNHAPDAIPRMWSPSRKFNSNTDLKSASGYDRSVLYETTKLRAQWRKF